ncbi:MAG: SpoIIE family protein phosphatase [Pirellulaceae bacterium]
MPNLEVVSGINEGESHPLEERETLLGRHPDCQIVLRDSTVSRRHARITQDGNHHYVNDVGSQHGTRVNGEVIRQPHLLRHGDEIQLSQVTLVFRDEAEESGGHSSTIITSLDVVRSDTGTIEELHTAPKWKALLDITRSLGVSLDLQTILPKVLENVFHLLPQASRGCVMLAEPPDGSLRPAAVRHSAGTPDAPPAISRTITEKVISEGKAILSTDAGEDERFQASDSVLDLKMRSIMCAPLVGASNVPLGMIQLDAQDPGRQFSADDLDVLVNIANLVGQAVDHAHLHETAMQFDRRERDLETARQVQTHFLPRERPSVTGYELFDYYNPADAVGGDYFGYTILPDGQLAIAVGDVAGHGIPAALLMARLCSEARYCLVTNLIPSDAVDSLNRELCKQTFSFFITFAICVIDPLRHEMTVVNAGHMPPLLRHGDTGEVEAVAPGISSPPLGIDSELRYQQAKITLQPGDLVMMYTDGVSEALGPSGAMYGIERVEKVVTASDSPRDLMKKLLTDVRRFTKGNKQEDDVCVVAFSRKRETDA